MSWCLHHFQMSSPRKDGSSHVHLRCLIDWHFYLVELHETNYFSLGSIHEKQQVQAVEQTTLLYHQQLLDQKHQFAHAKRQHCLDLEPILQSIQLPESRIEWRQKVNPWIFGNNNENRIRLPVKTKMS